MHPLLEVSHINLSFHSLSGETYVLSDISFKLHDNEFIAIVGPSGCGKSTLLNLIAGLIPVTNGKIYIKDTPVYPGNPYIGYMLQKDHLLNWRSVYKNIILGLEIQKKCTPENLDYAEKLLNLYGLKDFRNSYPNELSGGMRQRAALIRTLVLKPSLLLLDEPFSALDYQTRLKVSNDIGCILKKNHKPAILVTHDISEAISMADRVIILSSRPAHIQKIIDIRLSVNERTPLSSREAPEFKNYFNEIWNVLNTTFQKVSPTSSAQNAGGVFESQKFK